MQYRSDRQGRPLSVLGYGCLRFPQTRGRIDLAETERQVLAAIEAGVNYFDTAYIYSGSEEALGEILARNRCRDRVHITTKLPHYLIKKSDDLERCFQEQLRRLRTDHVDYYLMHMLPDLSTWRRLESLGVPEWLAGKRASGQIGGVGFSYHGNTNSFLELLEAYDWDLCQIQYNYLDEHTQAGRRGLQRAAERGIPVVIMEPLRGGRLVHGLPVAAVRRFQDARPQRSPAEWGLRWLWDQSEVTVVLSGMNSLEMVRENCRAADEARPGQLTAEDFRMFEDVKASINAKIKVGCTGCGYCMPCPHGVDIPGSFRCYNARYTDGLYTAMKEYFLCTTLRGRQSNAGRCVGCGRCERRCPQAIPIRQKLHEAARVLENPAYHIVRAAARLISRF